MVRHILMQKQSDDGPMIVSIKAGKAAFIKENTNRVQNFLDVDSLNSVHCEVRPS